MLARVGTGKKVESVCQSWLAFRFIKPWSASGTSVASSRTLLTGEIVGRRPVVSFSRISMVLSNVPNARWASSSKSCPGKRSSECSSNNARSAG